MQINFPLFEQTEKPLLTGEMQSITSKGLV